MADIESGPGYKNKHPKAIYLDAYNGVACDLMELNKPAADRFMQVGDMRGDIVIVQKPQDRVRDYDEIGFIRVAKFLKIPRLDLWHNENELLQTKKEDGVWYLAINDQDLANQVVRAEGDNRKFDDRFVDAFRNQVRSGLTAILRREKLLNGGEYDLSFLFAYYGLIKNDLLVGPILVAGALLSEEPWSTAKTLGVIAAANAIWNTGNLLLAGITWADKKMFGIPKINLNTPDFNYPFVKHSVVDLVMPPVPVDRLVRGLHYLNTRGNELIYPTPGNFTSKVV